MARWLPETILAQSVLDLVADSKLVLSISALIGAVSAGVASVIRMTYLTANQAVGVQVAQALQELFRVNWVLVLGLACMMALSLIVRLVASLYRRDSVFFPDDMQRILGWLIVHGTFYAGFSVVVVIVGNMVAQTTEALAIGIMVWGFVAVVLYEAFDVGAFWFGRKHFYDVLRRMRSRTKTAINLRQGIDDATDEL